MTITTDYVSNVGSCCFCDKQNLTVTIVVSDSGGISVRFCDRCLSQLKPLRRVAVAKKSKTTKAK
jgi:hypothetical protein